MKPTKRLNLETLNQLLDVAENAGITFDIENISYKSLHEFIDKELEILENKTAAAKKRAEEKREKGDELRERILNLLSDEPMIINDITVALDDVEVSTAMVTNRLGQLVKLGLVEKVSVTVPVADTGKSRKLNAYKVA